MFVIPVIHKEFLLENELREDCSGKTPVSERGSGLWGGLERNWGAVGKSCVLVTCSREEAHLESRVNLSPAAAEGFSVWKRRR